MEYYGSPVAAPDGSLANSISVTDWISHNDNYTEWTFNVKPGLKWSDSTDITSKDILTTFSPSFGFNATYDYLGMGPEVKSEYALNNSAAFFVLNAPDAHWPDKFNWDLYTPVYPASFIQTQGAASSNFGTDVVSGPFYVSNYQSGQTQMVMLRNPYFVPQPQISEIDVNFVESLSLTTGILQSGSTDLALVEPSNVQAVVQNANIHILDEKGLYVSDLQYNDSLYPYNMTNFRQALAFGIDQNAFVKQALNGYGLTAYSSEGVVSPSATLWYNPTIEQYSFDQTKSLALLSQIGITKGSDGFLHYPNATAISLTLWTDTDNTVDTVGASVVQSNLQSLGFKVNLQTTSASNIVGNYASNANGIRSAIILFTSNPPVWGNPYLDSLPAWDVYWLPTIPNHFWEYPPNIDAQYQSNFTAFQRTADQGLEQRYLGSIQALNAQYLPTIILAYPDAVWAYNTQYWTNWPTGYIQFGAQIMNNTAFVNLQPAGSTNTGSATTTSVSSGPNYITLSAIGLVIVAAGAATGYFLRRRTKTRNS
jgi:peptide/nickel transport system substrate-binding protein